MSSLEGGDMSLKPCPKGTTVKPTSSRLSYSLKTDNYTDKDGNKHYQLVARIDTVQLIDSKAESAARAARRENSADNAAANSSEEVPF